MKTPDSDSTPHHDGCCADIFSGQAAPSFRRRNAKGVRRADARGAGVGRVERKAKELILFSLVSRAGVNRALTRIFAGRAS